MPERPFEAPDVKACVDAILRRVGKRIVLGLPLGLGKPNHLVNALYQRAVEDREIELVIATALTLEPPRWDGELERRLVEPIRERLYGDYPELVEQARAAGKLPADYRIPDPYRENTPQRVRALIEGGRGQGLFARFPFGTDLTEEEQTLGRALRDLQQAVERDKRSLPGAHELRAAIRSPPGAWPYLERMCLHDPDGLQERVLQPTVLYALARIGAI